MQLHLALLNKHLSQKLKIHSMVLIIPSLINKRIISTIEWICCGTIFCQTHHPERENCHGKIENLIQKITNGGIASSIVLAILIWIAAVFCLIDSKVFLKNEKDGSLLKSDLEQPILENTN